MAIADLFRPKHKNSKSEVRAAAVAAMDHDDIDLLVEVASADVDTSIRRSAIAKLSDPDALASVAQRQDDGKLRAYANGLAVEIWLATAIASTDLKEAKASFNQAAAHGGDRALAEIAAQAQLSEVRSQALARLEDEPSLAQVVRKSQRAEDWKDAIARIDSSEILRSIAVDERRKEVATAALDRIVDPLILDEVASKAKNKSVRGKAKRLRAALATDESSKSTTSSEEKRAAAERSQLVRELQLASESDDWNSSRAQVDECLRRWEELGESGNAKLNKKFEKARIRYENAYESHGKAEAGAAAKKEREEATALAAEEAREARALVTAEDTAVDVDADAEATPSSEVPEDAQTLSPKVDSAAEARRASEEDKRLDNQDEIERLCEMLEEILDSQDMRGLDRTLKESDKTRRKIGSLPASAMEALRARYDEARRKAVIRLGELREADDWKRWSTVPKMEALVVKVKELLADAEAKKVGESLKALQKEWKELGAAPREKGDELWKVFKATCDEVYERVKVERESRNAEQLENYDKKEALCVRAEELQSSTDWQETSNLFKEMQTEWKGIGPVPRRKSDGQWKRFRAACDAFFEARAPHLEDQHAELEDNLVAKQELIKEVEKIAVADGDVEEQLFAVRALQRQWREIGKVAHRAFEELNDAYKVACDKVYNKRTELQEAENAAKLLLVTMLEDEIVECADAGWDSDADEIAKKVLDLRSRYLQMDQEIEGYQELGPKVESLIRSQLESEPDSYKNSVLDLDKSKASYEALIAEAEALVPQEEKAEDSEDSEGMAEKLREALADRALGGVLSKDAGPSAADRISELQAKWPLIGPVPGAEGSALQERFAAVCSQVLGA